VIGRDCWLDDDSLLDARGGGRIALGDGAQLHRFAFLLTHGGNITFGTNCSVNSFSILYGHGGLLIGDNVRIAAHVVIIPANHRFDRTDVPIAEQGVSAQGIVVEDDVWIGTGARILDGCHVGRGSVIGAGAVVSHDIEPYSIAVGIPAKRVGSRLG
jgi:acetyltransferase-like isoleucine patch superfamily enzyme